MAEDCDFCPSSLVYRHGEFHRPEPSLQECRELFHQWCPTCPPGNPQDDWLCDCCQHLRFQHLMRCVSSEISMLFCFRLKNVSGKTLASTNCSLCRIVNHMLHVGLGENMLSQLNETGYDIRLRFHESQPQASGNLLADIVASFRNIDGPVSMWVGNLHIDRGNKGGTHFGSTFSLH